MAVCNQLKIVDQEPEDLGYEFGKWTAKRLATYLETQTGIKLSSSCPLFGHEKIS
jgi:hypothetical protein